MGSSIASKEPNQTLPRGRTTPLPTISPHIKRLRYLLISTVISSAYSLFLSIQLSARLSSPLFLSTSALALWTLALLFPLELSHHELGIAAATPGAEKHTTAEEGGVVSTWAVDKAIIQRSYVTAGLWVLAGARSVYSLGMGMTQVERGTVGEDVWVVLALEVASAAFLYRLASQWTPEASLPAPKVETPTVEVSNEKAVESN